MKSLKLLDIFFTVFKILFSLTMSMKFTDIDECSLATTPCDQECTNLNGSFQCTCRPGYSLEEDKTACSSMSYLCYSEVNFSSSHESTKAAMLNPGFRDAMLMRFTDSPWMAHKSIAGQLPA